MRKHAKRIAALLMTLAMLLAMVPAAMANSIPICFILGKYNEEI